MKSPPPSLESRFLRACARRDVDAVPVWFMRQAGRYLPGYRALRTRHSILDIAKTPELACEATLEPIRKFALDAAIIFADILLPLEAMGLRLSFVPAPRIERPIRRPSDLKRLASRPAGESLAFVGEAIRLARRELDGKVPLIGFAGAPFTLASYMIEGGPSRDFLLTKAFLRENPGAWTNLMERIVRVTLSYLRMQAASGAQAIQIFDSWAGALSPEDYRAGVLPATKRLFSGLKGLGVPLIYFGSGASGFLEDFASAGAGVIGVDWRIDIGEAFRRLPGKAVQGNLDPALLLAPRPVLKKAALRILRQASGRRGFIFNLGHGILPQTPPDNVRALAEWVHQYGRQGTGGGG